MGECMPRAVVTDVTHVCVALWVFQPGPEGRARAFFSAPPPTVVFCANRLHSAREVEETMVHELIHAYDVRESRCVCVVWCLQRPDEFVFCGWVWQFTVRNMDITKSDLLACRCV